MTFLDNLRLALAVYRDANVEVTERGVDLHPFRPPIAPRQVAAGKVQTPTGTHLDRVMSVSGLRRQR